MDESLRLLFERYEKVFKDALGGRFDLDGAASLYASEFIAATPAGVMTGKNDEKLKDVMAKAYAHYQTTGMKDIRVQGLRVSPIDEHHCVAHVAWSAIYARKGQPDAVVDFEVHYLVRELDAQTKVFGWISGDEQALLKKHGIVSRSD